MLRRALFDLAGPVAVRYPRGGEEAYRGDASDKPLVRLREGKGVTLLAYGVLVNQALEAAARLERRGIQAEVLKLNQIAPLDGSVLADFFQETDIRLVLEDCFGAGCVGQRVAAILAGEGRAPRKLILKNRGRTFAPEGSVPQLEERFGLDAAAVAAAVEEACHER